MRVAHLNGAWNEISTKMVLKAACSAALISMKTMAYCDTKVGTSFAFIPAHHHPSEVSPDVPGKR
ncbi:hypothetical protein [Stenotrophomonas sp.]|uniref:hypothetical protein n=1 Tax=Stenotrophomonas sp. TaxID=69392 RepID=UPI0028A6E8FD|nr:hypothetical protein [Stenotrophomonas sp.]